MYKDMMWWWCETKMMSQSMAVQTLTRIEAMFAEGAPLREAQEIMFHGDIAGVF